MRYRFEQQITLGFQPINEVTFPLRSRDELPAVLKALQHIFITPELNEKVFTLLESKFIKGKKKTGRRGMDLWQVFVLAVVRHTLGTNWDRLEHIANHDLLVRQVLGIHSQSFGVKGLEFSYQSIIDNVSILDEELLLSINQIIVDAGRELLKKKTIRQLLLSRLTVMS
jgi:transposase, IS5 family